MIDPSGIPELDRPFGRVLAGLFVLGVGAGVAFTVGNAVGINELLFAIVVGFVVSNTVGIPTYALPGVRTHNLWLAAGIVLMGSSLTVGAVLEAGPTILLVVGAVAVFTVLVIELLSRSVFGLTDRLGSLLAAGTSICGVSAIVAVGGSIRANQEQIAYAAAIILLFDALTILIYPYVGSVLGLSDVVFGIWAGVSMFSTGPVVAVGFAHSDAAGQWATVTKLTRNALIGVVVLVYASVYARNDVDGSASVGLLWESFPTFVLGFFAMVLVASTGVLSSYQPGIEHVYNGLFMLAFVGLGTEIRLAKLRRVGLTPVLVVTVGFVVASLSSLALLVTVL